MLLLSVITATTAGATLFWVTGDVDCSTAQELRDTITSADVIAGPDVSVEMSGVAFMDCAGVSALIAVGDTLYQQGVQLRIIDPSRAVERIIDLCGLRDNFCFDHRPDRSGLKPLATITDEPCDAAIGHPAVAAAVQVRP